MPGSDLIRSVSASQLSSCEESAENYDDNSLVKEQPKAYTLQRFTVPSFMRDESENKRKRFMSFRLKKEKRKESCSDSSNGNFSKNSDESMDARNELKRKSLIKVGSFVRRVASRVQSNNPAVAAAPLSPSHNPITANPAPVVSIDYIKFQADQAPAVIGLRNHGNTCFINAIIQCLNHTDILAEYFVLDSYKQDLRRCSRASYRKTSSGLRKGEMTEQVAGVLKALWTLRYVPDVSLALKSCIERHEPTYRGANQHDAAEFLMFILGKIHDDLNTASKKKYKRIKSSYGRSDESVASETLNNHLRCNSSFIQDIFQAQFRSSLCCPHCNRESNTFDPFMCVSLPIPHQDLMIIYVTVVYLNQQPKQVCLGMSVACKSVFGELRSSVAADCGLELESIILTEVASTGFHRTFSDENCVDCVDNGGSIYAVELPLNKPVQDHGPFVTVIWVNVFTDDDSSIHRFGGLYQSQVARDLCYEDLQKLLLKEMAAMVTMNTLVSEQQSGVFKLRVHDGSTGGTTIERDAELPLYSECVDQSLALNLAHPHLKLVLHWTKENKDKFIIDDVDHVEQHSSVKQMKDNPPVPPATTLAQCFQLHSSAEQLSTGDAWFCPTCNRKQQGVKRLMLWSAPEILVVHLKRFKQIIGCRSSKLNTLVTFPLHSLDITEHVARKSLSSTTSSNKITNNVPKNSNRNFQSHSGMWSPWRKPKRICLQDTSEKYIYDLYAICNHHGEDLQSGHYTAICLNPSSGEWHKFDDSKVTHLESDEVVNSDAYVLFYQRRDSRSHRTVSQDRENNYHWCYRIPKNCLPASLNSSFPDQNVKSVSEQTDKNIKSNQNECGASKPTASNKVFERGQSYGTLPNNRAVLASSQADSTERENCSDTEAPPAMREDSPVANKITEDEENYERNTMDHTENDDKSTREMSEIQNLPGESFNIADYSHSETETVRNESNVKKTVLIARNQGVDNEQDITTDQSKVKLKEFNQQQNEHESHSCEINWHCSNKSSRTNSSQDTPNVLIQPASPTVIAAHKKSIIKVTLRPRSPSSQHDVSRPESTSSKTSSSGRLSSFSPDTLACIITVNGVSLAENEKLNAEFASSLAVAAAQAAEDFPPPRSCHISNSASFVHVKSPSVKNKVSISQTSENKTTNAQKTNLQNRLSSFKETKKYSNDSKLSNSSLSTGNDKTSPQFHVPYNKTNSPNNKSKNIKINCSSNEYSSKNSLVTSQTKDKIWKNHLDSEVILENKCESNGILLVRSKQSGDRKSCSSLDSGTSESLCNRKLGLDQLHSKTKRSTISCSEEHNNRHC